MIIYYYDENGRYTGSGKSHSLPEENATTQKPEQDDAIFNGTEWVSPILTLEELKTKIKSQIDQVRYSKIYSANIPYTFPSGPDGIQMRDETDRQNIQDMVIDAMNKAPESTMYFMPVSNSLQTMTAQDVIDMGLNLKFRGDAIMGHSWTLKGQIDASETVEAVNAIDITTGWPE